MHVVSGMIPRTPAAEGHGSRRGKRVGGCISWIPLVLMLAVCAPGRAEIMVGAFDAATTEVARLLWRPATGSPPVGIFRDAAGIESPGIRFPCWFTESAVRCYWDHTIAADFSGESVVALRVYVADPAPISYLTLYFQSPGGWYSASASLRRGWQTLRWSRSSFSIEGTPAGWDRITGIRFSPWKAAVGETEIIANALRAYTPPIAVARGTLGSDTTTARGVAELVESALDMLGLEYTLMTDEDVEAGGLAGSRLAIFPYNSGMSTAELERLAEYSAAGGKIIAFYSLPDSLANLLGIQNLGWTKISLGGMRWVSDRIACAPEYAGQHSWNIHRVRPSAKNAFTWAVWENAEGQTLTDPAWIVSDTGAYMSHILLSEDWETKQKMLLALVLHFHPELEAGVLERALSGIGQVGRHETFEETASALRSLPRASFRRANIERELTEAERFRARAADSLTSGPFCDTLDLIHAARRHLLEAYYQAQTPVESELRGVWNHSGTGAYPGDWNRSAERLAAAGFNAVFPNMLWGGLAHYNSSLLPRSSTYETHGDQITACLQACHARGIEVHVWKVNWNLSNAPAGFVAALRAEGRTQVDVRGDAVDWLCPSDPRNLQLELDSMLEVAENYAVDGLHFDYIRYPDNDTCYCAQCRARFESARGAAVADWPADCHGGTLRDAYRDWRCQQITRLVRGLREAVDARGLSVKISAAVFPDYPSCRTTIAQDWVEWVREGYLDILCPMDYTASLSTFESRIARQRELTAGAIPIYPGVGVRLEYELPADQLLAQLGLARTHVPGGYLLFNFDARLAEYYLPILYKGFTAPPDPVRSAVVH